MEKQSGSGLRKFGLVLKSVFKFLFKAIFFVFVALWEILKFLWKFLKKVWQVLRKGWKVFLRKAYEKLTDLTPDEQPTFFEVLAALRANLKQLPVKKRRAAYIGIIACLLVAVFLVAGLISTLFRHPSSGNSSDGGFTIVHREPFVPEFAKLDCLTCHGDGDCNTCGGYGEVDRYAGAGDTVRSKCSSCYGSGNCRTCGGSGKR